MDAGPSAPPSMGGGSSTVAFSGRSDAAVAGCEYLDDCRATLRVAAAARASDPAALARRGGVCITLVLSEHGRPSSHEPVAPGGTETVSDGRGGGSIDGRRRRRPPRDARAPNTHSRGAEGWGLPAPLHPPPPSVQPALTCPHASFLGLDTGRPRAPSRLQAARWPERPTSSSCRSKALSTALAASPTVAASPTMPTQSPPRDRPHRDADGHRVQQHHPLPVILVGATCR